MTTTSENVIASAKAYSDGSIDWYKVLISYMRAVGRREGDFFAGSLQGDGLTPQEEAALEYAKQAAFS